MNQGVDWSCSLHGISMNLFGCLHIPILQEIPNFVWKIYDKQFTQVCAFELINFLWIKKKI